MTVGTEPGATSTTVDDGNLAGFAASVELAAADLYDRVIAKLTGSVATVARIMQTHHRAHAAAFNAAAGSKAVLKPNARLLSVLRPPFSAATDHAAALALAMSLEDKLAATHQLLLGMLVTPAGLSLVASVEPVEGQHVVVLGTFLGKAVTELVPASFGGAAQAIDPAVFPAGG